MMNLSAKSSSGERRSGTPMAVILLCVQMLQPGCGIPPLRRAEPGPALPQHFPTADYDSGGANGQFEESIVFGPGTATADDKSVADESRQGGATTVLASFRQPSHWVALKHASAESNQDIVVATYDETVGQPQADEGISSESNFLDTGSATAFATPGPVNVGEGPVSLQNSSHSPWYEFFDDPLLAALIDQALWGNQELRILAQEIWIANNEVEARRGEYLPFVRLGAGAGIDKASRYTRDGAVEEALEVAPGKSFPEPLPDFLLAADLSWEVDIWRKLRNARDAAALRYLGTQDGQNYVVTRLVAEVAGSYYELMALDNRRETLDRTIAIQEQSLQVAESMKEAGRATELAVQRFQAEVRKNQSEKLIIEQDIIEIENRINFLLGRYPQPVPRASRDFLDLNLRALNVGMPAQLLQNRPDIRQAERELEAAGLDIEVARARFYPSLDITAGVGYQAFNPRYLFITPEALIYNVVGELVMPVINRKAIKAAYRTANAKQIQSAYDYQQTVLNAYTEVVNYMTKVENYGESIEIKKQQLAALEASVDSASKLFQNARAEYVEVLLAQREMMEARMLLIELKQQQLSAVINTYQALGGGGAGFADGVLANCPPSL